RGCGVVGVDQARPPDKLPVLAQRGDRETLRAGGQLHLDRYAAFQQDVKLRAHVALAEEHVPLRAGNLPRQPSDRRLVLLAEIAEQGNLAQLPCGYHVCLLPVALGAGCSFARLRTPPPPKITIAAAGCQPGAIS